MRGRDDRRPDGCPDGRTHIGSKRPRDAGAAAAAASVFDGTDAVSVRDASRLTGEAQTVLGTPNEVPLADSGFTPIGTLVAIHPWQATARETSHAVLAGVTARETRTRCPRLPSRGMGGTHQEKNECPTEARGSEGSLSVSRAP